MYYTKLGLVHYIINKLSKIDNIDTLNSIIELLFDNNGSDGINHILNNLDNLDMASLELIYRILAGDYITNDQTFENITCGLSINKNYKISDLVCAIINSTSPEEFFGRVNGNGKVCTQISSSIASNIIRVASRRIFTDPYRSFVEPIANSIDSYRELNGNKSNVGKFGMGFFSLLYWLQDADSNITIESSYKISDDKYCKWSAVLTYNLQEDQYYFNLINSVNTNDKKTGATIILNINKAFSPYGVISSIERAFIEVKDIRINYRSYNMGNRLQQINKSINPIGVVDVKIVANTKIIFDDQAKGLSLATFLTKLLVPSVSTKTIKTFIDNSIMWDKPMSYYKPKSIPFNESYFIITVGDIGIYMSRKYASGLYIWALPAQTPLPVSRDDIILSDPKFYEVALQELKRLIDITLEKNGSIDDLFDYLNTYAEYASDINIYNIIDDAKIYLTNHPDVYLVPKYMSKFYNDIIYPITKTKTKYISSDLINVSKLNDHLFSSFIIDNTTFNNMTIIVVPNVKKFGDVYNTGGLVNILFVDKNFIDANLTDWSDKLVKISNINLYYSVDKIESNLLLDSVIKNMIISKDKLIVDYVYKFKDIVSTAAQKEELRYDNIVISGDILYIELYNAIITPIYDIGKFVKYDRKVTDTLYQIIYIAISTLINRDLEYSNELSYIELNPFKLNSKIYELFATSITNIIDKNIPDHDVYVIKNDKERYYLLNTFMFMYKSLTETKSRTVYLFNPIDFLIFDMTMTGDINLQKWFVDYMVDKHYIYGIYMMIVIHTNTMYFIENRNKHFKSMVEFIYKEISSRYSIDILKSNIEDIISGSSTIQNLNSFMYKIYTAINQYNSIKSLQNVKFSFYDINPIKSYDTFYTFNAKQLINYIFKNDVDLSGPINWLHNVEKDSGDIQLQSLEIAINEGTSKPFITSVITELTQNAVDASRSNITFGKNNRKCKNFYNNSYSMITDGEIKPIKTVNNANNPKGHETILYCPDNILLYIGDTSTVADDTQTSLSISMRDFNGIPLKGLLALMIPFYSTKKSDEATTTGEMGTGFMNVYRQPYTKNVIINTQDPQTCKVYKLIATPIIENERVVDVKYQLIISNKSSKSNIELFGTSINVNLNEFSHKDSAVMITDALLFSNNFYRAINLKMSINYKSINTKLVELYNSTIGSIYFDANDHEFDSVMTTNGIPFGNLSDYVNAERFNFPSWLATYSQNGMILNLNKDSYVPVQSRKRIIMSDEGKSALNKLIMTGVVLKILNDIAKWSKSYMTLNTSYIDYILPGFSYSGSPDAVKPDTTTVFLSGRLINYSISSEIPTISDIINAIIDSDKLIKDAYMTKNQIYDIINSVGYDFVDDLYKNIVYMWFKNKKLKAIDVIVDSKNIKNNNEIIVVKDTNDKNKEKVAITLVAIPDIIINFMNDISKQAWSWIVARKDDKTLTGNITSNRNAPFVTANQVLSKHLKGVYTSNDHHISLNPDHINIKDLEKSLTHYKKLHQTNPNAASIYLRDDIEINKFIGIKSTAVTFVHEFGHAIRNTYHNDKNSHGGFNYTIYGETYAYNFDKGANDLFRRALVNYVPTF